LVNDFVFEATNVSWCTRRLFFFTQFLFLYDTIYLIEVELFRVRGVLEDLAGLFVMDAKVYLLIILFCKLLNLLDKTLSFVVERVVPFECFGLLQLSCLRYNLYNWILNWKLNHRITHQCWNNQVYKLYLRQLRWRRPKHSKGTTRSTTNERVLSRRFKSLQNNMIKRYTFASMTKRPARSSSTPLTLNSSTSIK
jgi:hypothetical protein